MKTSSTTVIAALTLSLSSGADTITVCTDGSCQYTDIQSAVNAASEGDVIRVGPGVYKESLTINEPGLTLVGIDGPENTVIDGESIRSGIDAWANHFEISGFTIQRCVNGKFSAAAISVRSPATIRNCIFDENVASGFSYVVDLCGGYNITVEDCRFSGNRNDLNGGALNWTCDFGDPVDFLDLPNTIQRCHFENNHSDGEGGAIWIDDPGTIIRECTFVSNTCGDDGGAIYATEMVSDTQIIDCLFRENTAGNRCGAIAAGSAETGIEVILSGCTFQSNQAFQVGAVGFYKTRAMIEDCLFQENVASVSAGALGTLSQENITTLRNCLFIGNTVSESDIGYGGDIVAENTMQIIECHFSGSSATFSRSMAFQGSTQVIDGCSFADQPDGGSTLIVKNGGAGWTLKNSTFCSISEELAVGNAAGMNDGGNNQFEADCPDCDQDGIPDSVAIRMGLVEDTNGDGIPDGCDTKETPCPADITGDENVDGADLSTLLAFWGECDVFCLGDIDQSGTVDGQDLALLLNDWGSCD